MIKYKKQIVQQKKEESTVGVVCGSPAGVEWTSRFRGELAAPVCIPNIHGYDTAVQCIHWMHV